MENYEDEDMEFVDDGTDNVTEGAVDPSAGYEPPPQEESPPQSYTPPPQPPVQPNYNQQAYDDVPAWVDEAQDINSYTKNVLAEAWNRFEQEWAAKQLRTRVETAEARAREIHNGSDGLPSYDEILANYAKPFLAQRPDLHRLVMAQNDVASAAYLIGFCAAYPHLVPRVLEKNGRLDKSIFQPNFRATVRGRNGGRQQPSGKVNYADWDNESFVAELDRFKLSSEGS